MATFRIHEDVENTVPNKINLVPSKLNEKRSTFAVLNNVQRGIKTHASKTVIFIQIFRLNFRIHNLKQLEHKFMFYKIFLQATDVPALKAKIFNDENEAPKDAFVPVDKFKAFNVVSGSNKIVSASSDEPAKMESIQNISTFR